MRSSIRAILFLSILAGCFSNAYARQSTEKMCWAHYVSWGFNTNTLYDTQRRFTQLTDRSLLGKWVSNDRGVYSTTRLQIESAIKYGVDGFCIDVIRPEGYMGAMKRMYDASEGLDFKISMCIDPWRDAATMTKLLEEYFEKFGKHPNNCYIDDKPVFFIYNPGHASKPSDYKRFKDVLDALKKKGYEGYWLVQPMRENSTWNDPEKLEEFLKVFDGFYDFGSNGLTTKQLYTRLENGRNAIDKYRPGGILVGGITQGYNGPFNAFYRPFGNTKTLRDNWQACIDAKADWVCITTWNDYVENTQFEPTVWNRDVLLRLNREYLRKWRGEPVIPRPAEVMVCYHQECNLGDDLTIEVASLPYTTDQAWCEVRLEDADGKIVRKFPPIKLRKNDMTVETLRIPGVGLRKEPTRMNALARTVSDLKSDAPFKRLYPITVRPSGIQQTRTVRFVLNDVMPIKSWLSAKKQGDQLIAKAGFNGWSWVGKAELLCNSHPVEEMLIAKEGPVRTDVNFDIKNWKAVYPYDEFVVRFTRADGRIFFTNPVLIKNRSADNVVKTNIIVTGSDFDEGWGLWRERQSRLSRNIIKEMDICENEVFTCQFPMDKPGKMLEDVGGWSVLTLLGKYNMWGAKDQHMPKFVDSKGPDGKMRKVLYFDGNDTVGLPVRLLPHGALTVEAWIKPEKTNGNSTIFADRNGAMRVQILPSGKLVANRFTSKVMSKEPLKNNKWYHIAVVYDGKTLAVYIDGNKNAITTAPSRLMRINSVGTIGAADSAFMKYGEFYKGYMGGLCITGRPLSPSEFKLK